MLSDPPEELTPGVLVTLERYFGRPTPTSPFPARVDRWLGEVGDRPPSEPLTLVRPLTTRLDGKRAVLRYLPPRGHHPGAVLVSEQRSAPDRTELTALGLTPREAEIVALVASGATNKDIARGRGIALGTVKKHLDNVYLKLGVHGRGPLTAFVFETLGTAASSERTTDPG
jgi:DNA-binding CsgD family transcriptional regulator